jgi:hypothetical protein
MRTVASITVERADTERPLWSVEWTDLSEADPMPSVLEWATRDADVLSSDGNRVLLGSAPGDYVIRVTSVRAMRELVMMLLPSPDLAIRLATAGEP